MPLKKGRHKDLTKFKRYAMSFPDMKMQKMIRWGKALTKILPIHQRMAKNLLQLIAQKLACKQALDCVKGEGKNRWEEIAASGLERENRISPRLSMNGLIFWIQIISPGLSYRPPLLFWPANVIFKGKCLEYLLMQMSS